eukprot:1193579-Prorocentrum_minimum.AAC.5
MGGPWRFRPVKVLESSLRDFDIAGTEFGERGNVVERKWQLVHVGTNLFQYSLVRELCGAQQTPLRNATNAIPTQKDSASEVFAGRGFANTATSFETNKSRIPDVNMVWHFYSYT